MDNRHDTGEIERLRVESEQHADAIQDLMARRDFWFRKFKLCEAQLANALLRKARHDVIDESLVSRINAVLSASAETSIQFEPLGGEFAQVIEDNFWGLVCAEPTAPVERVEFDDWYAKTQGTLGHGESYQKSMKAWMARAGMERKP